MSSTAQLHQVMDAFRQAPSNSERGTKFEQLMVRYFELDPALAARYDSVCRWVDWPQRGKTVDVGIDLVARDRNTGEWTAIQCKFYEPAHTISKADLDSFFTASGKTWQGVGFSSRIIISTTDKWSSNAENAIQDQVLPVARIGLEQMAEAPIDWSAAAAQDALTFDLTRSERYDPLPHQVTAIEKIHEGFAAHDRGQWISACGTGKTFTSLRLAEELTEQSANKTLRVLFLAPSIQLVSQTLREWTAQARHPLSPQVVCSDAKASRVTEDISPTDVPLPATTDAAELARRLELATGNGLHVVFSTYQSLPVVAEAQDRGAADFDLILCDEAHRTTGYTLAGTDESSFTKVHDNSFIRGTKRLYMTATPRVYGEAASQKAAENSVVLTSMDTEADFGPVFHTFSFGDAVAQGRLTDYKVLVLAVSGDAIAEDLQAQMTTDDRELQLDDATRIIGCWNGLAKLRGSTIDGESFPADAKPMQRAVAFLQTIAKSKALTEAFPRVVEMCEGTTTDRDRLECEVRHVDGTMNALQRSHDLAWLKAPVPEGECRILANARCLSEGVDVPALDAVMFLSPRSSVVDVIQAVGRVMRRAPGKDYGYIILPVAIPAGVEAHDALNDNKRFEVVWKVLNALRSHDTRFDAIINSIALNKDAAPGERGDGSIMVDIIGGNDQANTPASPAEIQPPLFNVAQWRDAVFTKIVTKVGNRLYWEDWAKTVANVASNLTARIAAAARTADDTTTAAFETFLNGLRANLNESITQHDAESMLAQHIITKPIFDALFENYSFAAHNPVSIVMDTMLDHLATAGLEAETTDMADFYQSVTINASTVTSAAGKQKMISDLYEKFFKNAFPKQAASLGVVYTPIPIVDFILRLADQVCRDELGYGLTDEDVHVLDPFTGTGTFLARLLQSGIIRPEDLARKYFGELWANEVMLLAYYIACVNIEAAYHSTQPDSDYQPFPGATFTDTFQSSETGDRADTSLFPVNNQRIENQLHAPIRVIVGNPPYSKGQTSANDNNANLIYPTLRQRITDTYAARSSAKNKNNLYDSYLHALRWASDRIADHGVIAYVANNGWLDGNTAAGVRLSLADDFTHLWIYNLRGNMRSSDWRNEGGQVFGSGSQTGIAVLVGVKNLDSDGPCVIEYAETPDGATAEEKLELLTSLGLDTITWRTLTPNAAGDWLTMRSDDFATHPAINGEPVSYFRSQSAGVQTNRDAWAYNFSSIQVAENMQRMITTYNHQATTNHGDATNLTEDPTKIKWSRNIRQRALQGRQEAFRPDNVRRATYRPFTRESLYFDPVFNSVPGKNRTYFPTSHHENLGFNVMAPRSEATFCALMTDTPIDVALFTYTGQYFPRWTYEHEGATSELFEDDALDEWGYRRIDNVSDTIQSAVATRVGAAVSKDDVFFYVYGVLHSPEYRDRYAADMKKVLPRIPLPSSLDQFEGFAQDGRSLSDLHVGYESADPYPLEEVWASQLPEDPYLRYGVTSKRMTFTSKTDKSTLVVNPYLTLRGIPSEAHQYVLGGKSALGWVVDRYRITNDKKSRIVNDPNDWAREQEDPTYTVDLIKRVVQVSVSTCEIVASLPPLDLD